MPPSASQRSWSPRSPSRCRDFRCRRCSRSPPKSTLPQTSLFRECLAPHVAFFLRPLMLSLFNGRGRRGFAHRRFKRLTIPTAEVRCGPYVLSRNAMSVVSFMGFPALLFVLSHSPPPVDRGRPKCWEINRDLHTLMYSDVQGSVNLISQSLKYSHA
jgi:hypothetical protein